jgi:hypothetical protein
MPTSASRPRAWQGRGSRRLHVGCSGPCDRGALAAYRCRLGRLGRRRHERGSARRQLDRQRTSAAPCTAAQQILVLSCAGLQVGPRRAYCGNHCALQNTSHQTTGNCPVLFGTLAPCLFGFEVVSEQITFTVSMRWTGPTAVTCQFGPSLGRPPHPAWLGSPDIGRREATGRRTSWRRYPFGVSFTGARKCVSDRTMLTAPRCDYLVRRFGLRSTPSVAKKLPLQVKHESGSPASPT